MGRVYVVDIENCYKNCGFYAQRIKTKNKYFPITVTKVTVKYNPHNAKIGDILFKFIPIDSNEIKCFDIANQDTVVKLLCTEGMQYAFINSDDYAQAQNTHREQNNADTFRHRIENMSAEAIEKQRKRHRIQNMSTKAIENKRKRNQIQNMSAEAIENKRKRHQIQNMSPEAIKLSAFKRGTSCHKRYIA